ncbi:hypothetical protein ONS96_011346 [Cadophora gregata f. sp. sojae]|nr:hypothetical protein ONS96_011346 [Cadophora gregata f. sp. sojae]
MSTSGVKHFTDKCEIAKRYEYGMNINETKRSKLNLRMTVPYKDRKRTMFAKSALRGINTVLQNDHRSVCQPIRGSMSLRSSIESNRNNQTDFSQAWRSGQIERQALRSSIKRPAIYDGSSQCPAKLQKTPKRRVSEHKSENEIRRIRRRACTIKKLKSLSRRYNGPNGYITPPTEFKLYIQKICSEQKRMAFQSSTPLRLRLPDLRDMYLRKLNEIIIFTVRNWTIPTAKPRLFLSRKGILPGHYGVQRQKARDFILFIIQHRMTSKDVSFLTEIILKAEDQDLEALASKIESYEACIENEERHYHSCPTYTQEEIELLRPQIRNFKEADIRHRAVEKRKWTAWNIAKSATRVAEDVTRLKIDIAGMIREIEHQSCPGKRLLPENARPLSSIPLHLRANIRRRNEGDPVSGFGDIIPPKSFSLHMHARSIGRSKLSQVITAAEDNHGMENGRTCKLSKGTASTGGVATAINWRPIMWTPKRSNMGERWQAWWAANG